MVPRNEVSIQVSKEKFLFHFKSSKSQSVPTNSGGSVVSLVCLSESSLPLVDVECTVHHN